jgi:hypothetical protein
MTVEKDFFDIVASRLYSELLGYYRYRVKDEYCLLGTINGVIVGIVNGRMLDEKVGMSYHTMTLKQGLRIGAQLFAAKMEYHLDFLKQDEVWIVAESPNGFKRWMIEYELESRPETWHELGGVPIYVLTRALWEKHKAAKCQEEGLYLKILCRLHCILFFLKPTHRFRGIRDERSRNCWSRPYQIWQMVQRNIHRHAKYRFC